MGLRVYNPNAIGPDGKTRRSDGGPGRRSRPRAADPHRSRHPAVEHARKETCASIRRSTRTGRPGDPVTPTDARLRGRSGSRQNPGGRPGARAQLHHAWDEVAAGWLRAWRCAQLRLAQRAKRGHLRAVHPAYAGHPQRRRAGQEPRLRWSIDSSQDGWWSGTWGLLRAYGAKRADLYQVPASGILPYTIANEADFDGACPKSANRKVFFDVAAVLANDVLPKSARA